TALAQDALTLTDLGIKVRPSEDGAQVIVDTTSGILGTPVEASIREAGAKLGLDPLPVFTYLANTMRVGEREVPYSLVAATPLEHVARGTLDDAPAFAEPTAGERDIVLNDWTAKELNAKAGDPL